jgi:glycosyltransferase involved in cell wall biosynthesis
MPDKYFICPASNSINKHNETGSIGYLVYQFLLHLGKEAPDSHITAVVSDSYRVNSFDNVTIFPLIKIRRLSPLSRYVSLLFYVKSFLMFARRTEYRKAAVIQHLQPFAPGQTFNLFFLFKDRSKKYVLGPLIGPHVPDVSFSDEDWLASGSSEGFAGKVFSFISNYLQGITTLFFKPLNTRTIRNADVILFTDAYARDAYKKYISPNQKVQVIGVGAELDVFDRKQVEKDPDNFHILFPGRLQERKGCEYLIRAIAKAIEMDPSLNPVCTVVGSGLLQDRMIDLAAELGITDRVVFLGGVESNHEIAEYYNKADVVCMPALSDTWVSVVESLCCGTPVIVTDLASHPEHVRDGFNGVLVPPRDPDAIANALLELYGDRNKLKRLSDNAYKEARKKYDWTNVIRLYISAVSEQLE